MAGPTRDERHVETGIIKATFAMGKCHAVIAHEHDQGVVFLSMAAQDFECVAKRSVSALDFVAVVGKVFADAWEVRQMGGQLELRRVDIACIVVPGMMRVVVVDPEEPGLVSGDFGEELFELLRRGCLGGDVEVVDAVLPGAPLVLLVDLGSDRGWVDDAVKMEVAAADTGVIILGAQDFGNRQDVRGEWGTKAAMRAATGERPVISAVRDGTRWGAAVKARSKTTPSRGNLSRLGVDI